MLVARWAPPEACARAEDALAGEKGKWIVISDRLLGDLEKEGKKPAWPGDYAWDPVGNAYFAQMGQPAWEYER